LNAAPVTYEDDKPANNFTYFKKQAGDWAEAKNWDKKKVPAEGDDAIIRDNASATLSVKVPTVRLLGVGGVGFSTLTVSQGGHLEVLGKLHVNRNGKNTTALLFIDGGYVRLGTDEKDRLARMELGTSVTHACKAWTKINGGTLEGSICVGQKLPGAAAGTLSINGSTPSVSGKIARDILLVYPTGTLEFILDKDGVACADYSKTTARLLKGATLIVEGGAYDGGAKIIPLVLGKKFSNDGAQVRCTEFKPNYAAQVTFDNRGAFLRIKTK